jgi:hypothetical protein
MASYPPQARGRAMKVEEVILRAVSGQITFWQAARILRMSPRHLRRVMQRYRHTATAYRIFRNEIVHKTEHRTLGVNQRQWVCSG